MARKSRYSETCTATTEINSWNSAGYGRLSVEDTGEAESLVNQELMLRLFIEKAPDMKLSRIYSDNGLTGTNFARPGFEALMDAIRRGEINCVVVKDLSRFGRDYIEAGNFIETVFPSLGVRFISINDNFDSADPQCWADGMSIALKNIINAAYAKDISMKLRTAYDAKRRRGDYTGSLPPFGYRRLPDNKRQLIIDEEAAEIVRDIFRWRIEGATLKEIAARLDEADIPNPTHYAYLKGVKNDKRFAVCKPWEGTTVGYILGNIAYIGHLLLGKKIAVSMGNRVQQPEENWVTSYNTHEPIISQADFDIVAEINRQSTERRRDLLKKCDNPPLPDNIFKGYVYCGVCGYTFNRVTSMDKNNERTIHYTCLTCQKRGKSGRGKWITIERLESAIIESIRSQIQVFADCHALAESLCKSNPVSNRLKNDQAIIDQSRKRIAFIENNKDRLLSDHYDGLLSKEDYQRISIQREDERLALAKTLETLVSEMEQYTPEYWDSQKYVYMFEQVRNLSELTSDTMEAFVERIEVDENMNVNIKLRYQDEFAALHCFVNENGGVVSDDE